MKAHLALAALGAAMIMGGCVAYPVDGYHDRGDRSGYRDRDRDRDHRGEWRYDRRPDIRDDGPNEHPYRP